MKVNHPLIPILRSINKFSCPSKSNFHTHTNHSDGSLSPVDLFIQANNNKLENIAITDHHSIKAYKEIQNFIDQYNNIDYPTKLWSGIEITGLLKGVLVHILALGFDVDSHYLHPYLKGDSVKGDLLEASNIIQRINKANGLSVLAHPARYKLIYNQLINEAKKIGFDGVEVWYDYERSHVWRSSPFVCEKISDLVNRLGMLSTCGTDTHGLSLMHR